MERTRKMLLENATEIVEMIGSRGLNCAIDPRDLTLPGVLVTPTMITRISLDNKTAQSEYQISIVCPDIGIVDSLKELDRIISICDSVLEQAAQWDIGGIQMPNHSPDPLPSATTTISATTREA